MFFNSIRLLQDTRERDIGTPRGFGVDEDMALVITDLYTRPVGTVLQKIPLAFVFFQKIDNCRTFGIHRLLVQVEECFLLMLPTRWLFLPKILFTREFLPTILLRMILSISQLVKKLAILSD